MRGREQENAPRPYPQIGQRGANAPQSRTEVWGTFPRPENTPRGLHETLRPSFVGTPVPDWWQGPQKGRTASDQRVSIVEMPRCFPQAGDRAPRRPHAPRGSQRGAARPWRVRRSRSLLPRDEPRRLPRRTAATTPRDFCRTTARRGSRRL